MDSKPPTKKGNKKKSDDGSRTSPRRKQGNTNFSLTQMPSKGIDIPELTYSVKERIKRYESFNRKNPVIILTRSQSAKDVGQTSSDSETGVSFSKSEPNLEKFIEAGTSEEGTEIDTSNISSVTDHTREDSSIGVDYETENDDSNLSVWKISDDSSLSEDEEKKEPVSTQSVRKFDYKEKDVDTANVDKKWIVPVIKSKLSTKARDHLKTTNVLGYKKNEMATLKTIEDPRKIQHKHDKAASVANKSDFGEESSTTIRPALKPELTISKNLNSLDLDVKNTIPCKSESNEESVLSGRDEFDTESSSIANASISNLEQSDDIISSETSILTSPETFHERQVIREASDTTNLKIKLQEDKQDNITSSCIRDDLKLDCTAKFDETVETEVSAISSSSVVSYKQEIASTSPTVIGTLKISNLSSSPRSISENKKCVVNPSSRSDHKKETSPASSPPRCDNKNKTSSSTSPSKSESKKEKSPKNMFAKLCYKKPSPISSSKSEEKTKKSPTKLNKSECKKKSPTSSSPIRNGSTLRTFANLSLKLAAVAIPTRSTKDLCMQILNDPVQSSKTSKQKQDEDDYLLLSEDIGAIHKGIGRLSPQKQMNFKSNKLLNQSLEMFGINLSARGFETFKWLLNAVMVINMEEILSNHYLDSLSYAKIIKLANKNLCKVALIDFPRYYHKREEGFYFPIFKLLLKESGLKDFFDVIKDNLVPVISTFRISMLGLSIRQLKAFIFLGDDDYDKEIRTLRTRIGRAGIPDEMQDVIRREIQEINNRIKVVMKFIKNSNVLYYCYDVNIIVNDCLSGFSSKL
ncbi:flocculation protein FLO11-like isoform X2 [Centruroides sculpturatus]|uniref:flocculation protein FLO11-like isoform X2 n=1 Tax=Centruroides sculpturatus TaxID=218467 RepID=UPI000C6C93D1|nr:flocculation protein FLO11-like isoform X2 [Centruroides sculpturatus]